MQKDKSLRDKFCAILSPSILRRYPYELSATHRWQSKAQRFGSIRRHLQERERVKTNPNIDLSRSHLNYCIEDLAPDYLSRRVKERIAQLHLKKRPRSDAVGIEDIIVSASVDFMLNLDCDTREQYFRDSLHFFQRRYGKTKRRPKLSRLLAIYHDFHRISSFSNRPVHLKFCRLTRRLTRTTYFRAIVCCCYNFPPS